MGSDDRNPELLDLYVKSLEDHVENKKYFLQQVNDAIAMLEKKSGDKTTISEDDWKWFLKKPMYFPERSDPIGLSLASVGLRSRKDSSLHWLRFMHEHLKELHETIEFQKNVNQQLYVLIELIDQRIWKIKQEANDILPVTPEERNKYLLAKFEEFIKNFLSVDIADAEDIGSDIYDNIMTLIKRLISYDSTLKDTDFHHSSKGLFRLLLRSNLIEVVKNERNDRYIKLLDFRDEDLS